uniref:Uncharacterized protein n=1 Tax=Alexandrium catenella TaxID=2925 RepID=A0A7S1PPG8_ALECA
MSAGALAAAMIACVAGGVRGGDMSCAAPELAPLKASAMLQVSSRTTVRTHSKAALMLPGQNGQMARVCFHADTREAEILDFCKHMPGHSTCLQKGDSFTQGTVALPCWTVQATQEELPLIAARLPGRAGGAGGSGGEGQQGKPPQ